MQGESVVTFHRAIPDCRLPVVAADKSVGGSLPTQAFRYCEPMRQASGWGRYLFMPATVGFRLDGTDVEWFMEGESMGLLTAEPKRAVQYPGFAKHWDGLAPKDCRGYSPSWIACHFEPQVLQVWTGYFVNTQPGWSVLVRPPANLAPTTGVELYEGIVETDWWMGPLFVAIRLTHEGRVVTLSKDRPFVQVVPVTRESYRERPVETEEIAGWDARAWGKYHETVVQQVTAHDRKTGSYATKSRQRKD